MSGSVAVLVTTSVAGAVIVWSSCAGRTGGRLISLTTTMSVLDALTLGKPSPGLSVTTTVITFVLGPCASLGVQVSRPVAGSIKTPGGALLRLKVSTPGGRFRSVTEFV